MIIRVSNSNFFFFSFLLRCCSITFLQGQKKKKKEIILHIKKKEKRMQTSIPISSSQSSSSQRKPETSTTDYTFSCAKGLIIFAAVGYFSAGLVQVSAHNNALVDYFYDRTKIEYRTETFPNSSATKLIPDGVYYADRTTTLFFDGWICSDGRCIRFEDDVWVCDNMIREIRQARALSLTCGALMLTACFFTSFSLLARGLGRAMYYVLKKCCSSFASRSSNAGGGKPYYYNQQTTKPKTKGKKTKNNNKTKNKTNNNNNNKSTRAKTEQETVARASAINTITTKSVVGVAGATDVAEVVVVVDAAAATARDHRGGDDDDKDVYFDDDYSNLPDASSRSHPQTNDTQSAPLCCCFSQSCRRFGYHLQNAFLFLGLTLMVVVFGLSIDVIYECFQLFTEPLCPNAGVNPYNVSLASAPSFSLGRALHLVIGSCLLTIVINALFAVWLAVFVCRNICCESSSSSSSSSYSSNLDDGNGDGESEVDGDGSSVHGKTNFIVRSVRSFSQKLIQRGNNDDDSDNDNHVYQLFRDKATSKPKRKSKIVVAVKRKSGFSGSAATTRLETGELKQIITSQNNGDDNSNSDDHEQHQTTTLRTGNKVMVKNIVKKPRASSSVES